MRATAEVAEVAQMVAVGQGREAAAKVNLNVRRVDQRGSQGWKQYESKQREQCAEGASVLAERVL